MARKKTTGWDREVTVGEDGRAEWSTGSLGWSWSDRRGINLVLMHPQGDVPLCYAKNLHDAGMIAEGFAYGYESRGRGADAK